MHRLFLQFSPALKKKVFLWGEKKRWPPSEHNTGHCRNGLGQTQLVSSGESKAKA